MIIRDVIDLDDYQQEKKLGYMLLPEIEELNYVETGIVIRKVNKKGFKTGKIGRGKVKALFGKRYVDWLDVVNNNDIPALSRIRVFFETELFMKGISKYYDHAGGIAAKFVDHWVTDWDSFKYLDTEECNLIKLRYLRMFIKKEV